MIDRAASVASIMSAVGCGVIAGVLLAFSISVIPALRTRPHDDAIATMQQINVAIVTPAFLTVFFGSAATSIIAATGAVASDSRPSILPLTGAVLYVIGCFVVTVAVNVPLNTALAQVEPGSADGRRVWSDYLTRWTRWNHARTVAAVAACVVFTVAV